MSERGMINTGGELDEVGGEPRPFQLFIVKNFYDLSDVFISLTDSVRPSNNLHRLLWHCITVKHFVHSLIIIILITRRR